jgi:hypothetical protein
VKKTKKRKSRKQSPGVLAQKRASKKMHAFGILVAKNMEAGLTPAQAMAAAKNGVWVR